MTRLEELARAVVTEARLEFWNEAEHLDCCHMCGLRERLEALRDFLNFLEQDETRQKRGAPELMDRWPSPEAAQVVYDTPAHAGNIELPSPSESEAPPIVYPRHNRCTQCGARSIDVSVNPGRCPRCNAVGTVVECDPSEEETKP